MIWAGATYVTPRPAFSTASEMRGQQKSATNKVALRFMVSANFMNAG